MELLKNYKTSSAIIIGTIVIFLFTCAHVSERLVGFGPQGDADSIAAAESSSGHKWILRSTPSPAVSEQENPARALIESIKETTRVAAGSSDTVQSSDGGYEFEATFVDEQRDHAWNRQHPCLSRSELIPMYDERKYAQNLPPNPLWDELLVEYSKLHRTCTQKVGNLTEYFLSGNVSTGCRFIVADIASGTGLGNKFFVTVSSILYAILTQRVLLIPTSNLVPAITCEPFLGSSWALDPKTFPVPHIYSGSDFKNTKWTFDRDFFDQIDKEMEHMDEGMLESFESGFIEPARPLKHAVGVRNYEWQPTNRFYCSAEQTFYSQATWVYLSGCIYTIPKIFATPLFRPTLEALFPDKMVATRLLRSVLLPSDVVWSRVKRINHAYLAGADRRVGIQVRYKDGADHYTKMNDLVNERIMDCAVRHAILPNVSTSSRGGDSNPRAPFLKQQLESGLESNVSSNSSPKVPVVKVFMASLFSGLQEYLSKTYVRYPTVTGEDVGLVQISQDLAQVFGSVEEDQEALTEVLLLSFSDQLLVTPVSTFGGLAQAYGALTPWFIEMREDRQLPSCERGQTVDGCNQFVDKAYRCPHDFAVNERLFGDVVPYIKDCLSIDHSGGIQLITTFQS